MADFETHPAGTADLVKRLRSNTPNMAVGHAAMRHAADRIEQLEAQTTDLGDFLATYMAEAFTLDRSVKELTEALTRANAATAAAFEVAAGCVEKMAEDALTHEAHEHATQCEDAIRALATPDQTAALDRLIAEAVNPYVAALEGWMNIASHCSITDGSCCCGDDMENHAEAMNCGHVPVDHGSCVADGMFKTTLSILAASKKGGA